MSKFIKFPTVDSDKPMLIKSKSILRVLPGTNNKEHSVLRLKKGCWKDVPLEVDDVCSIMYWANESINFYYSWEEWEKKQIYEN